MTRNLLALSPDEFLNAKCRDCAYFAPQGIGFPDECRRRSPVHETSEWPKVSERDWCGEWMESPAAESER